MQTSLISEYSVTLYTVLLDKYVNKKNFIELLKGFDIRIHKIAMIDVE